MKRKTNSKKILIIDDNVDFSAATKTYLGSDLECELLIANRGDEGLRVYEKERPAVVLVDWIMPLGIDGSEVIRRVRAKEGMDTRPPYIIMITAHFNPLHAMDSLILGADDYLNKPVNMYELANQIRGYLNRGSLEKCGR